MKKMQFIIVLASCLSCLLACTKPLYYTGINEYATQKTDKSRTISAQFVTFDDTIPFTPIKKYDIPLGTERIEFVGFKNITRNNKMLLEFPAELDNSKMAFNCQSCQMRTFSAQELESYASQTQYIAFIDIIRWSYVNYPKVFSSWTDNPKVAYVLPFVGVANAKFQIQFNGEYELYLYDTLEKRLVCIIPIKVHQSDVYKGVFATRELDQRYTNLLYNALLDGFYKAHTIINEP